MQNNDPPPADDLPQSDPPAVVENVRFADVLSLPYEASNQTVVYGQDSLQFAELWLPGDADNSDLPVIVFVHGGCWSNLYRIEQSYPLAATLASIGFTVWSVEYRASGDTGGGWPGTANDVTLAVQTILDNAARFYSPGEHIIMGHSAGGHLGLLAMSAIDTDLPLRFFGLDAITDIASYANNAGGCTGLASSFMGGLPQDIPEAYQQATPDFAALAPFASLYTGSEESVVPLSQANITGFPVTVVENAGHFDWIHPNTLAFGQLLRDLFDP